ncbi:potassium channel family protein [Clostridium sp. DJ247]|uniref:potassium channel family protein n=1 Tax=Clostridium sp. DJ247 TaxID=2726188 RepID=UPI0016248596|nr:potassium channel family protein [Clostridium sp. DJ247]MBC2580113.1 potassium channel family protein [Clostridium sp. DJ247]
MIKDKKVILKLTYDILMTLLSLIAVVMLIIDSSYNLSKSITNIFEIIDNIILFIFVIDYFMRLFLAKDKKAFFKDNIIDLITIIPLDSVFQTAKILKLTRLLKFTKLFKILKILRTIVLLLKFRKHMDKFVKTNNFHYAIWITLTTLLVGTLGIHFAEGITYGDALWWSFVTITTVGYGDISPITPIGRVLAGFLMLVGIGFLSMLTSTISTFFISGNNSTSYKNETIDNIKTKLDNFDELDIEDIEEICKILKALKE